MDSNVSASPGVALNAIYKKYIFTETIPLSLTRPVAHPEASPIYKRLCAFAEAFAANLDSQGTLHRDKVRSGLLKERDILALNATNRMVRDARRFAAGIRAFEQLVETLQKPVFTSPITAGEGPATFEAFVDKFIVAMEQDLWARGYHTDTSIPVPKLKDLEGIMGRCGDSQPVDPMAIAIAKVLCYRADVVEVFGSEQLEGLPSLDAASSSTDLIEMINLAVIGHGRWKVARSLVLVASAIATQAGTIQPTDVETNLKKTSPSESRLMHTLHGFVCCISPLALLCNTIVTGRINSESPIHQVRMLLNPSQLMNDI